MKTNLKIAEHLDTIATMYELKGDESRMYAFHKAAAAIRSYPTVIAEMKLGPGSIQYVGPSTLGVVQEYLNTNTSKRFDELVKEVGLPDREVQELMKIPGVGVVRATKLWKEHGITTLAQLEEAFASGKIVDEKLQKALEVTKTQTERIPYDVALTLANVVVDKLKSFITQEAQKAKTWSPLIKRIEFAGSLRRKKETIKDVDILCATATDFDRHYLRELVRSTWPEDIIADGETRTRLRIAGRGVDIIYTSLESWGAALNYLTGSKDHNVRLRAHAQTLGYKVNEYSVISGKAPNEVRHEIKEERDLFDLLGIWYVPPTMRETAMGVNYAIQLSDLREVSGMTFEKAIELREKHGVTSRLELAEMKVESK
jgi:DNA polymerase (family X)